MLHHIKHEKDGLRHAIEKGLRLTRILAEMKVKNPGKEGGDFL